MSPKITSMKSTHAVSHSTTVWLGYLAAKYSITVMTCGNISEACDVNSEKCLNSFLFCF